MGLEATESSMRRLLPLAALVALTACSPRLDDAEKAAAKPETKAATPAAAQPPADAPAGQYTLDPTHTRVTFRVSHIGLSNYTAHFNKVEGKLGFDPANPAAQTVTATIDARSLDTDYPD